MLANLKDGLNAYIRFFRWSAFHAECNFERRVGVSLEMSVNIPDEEDIKRWLGEPIKSIIIPIGSSIKI